MRPARGAGIWFITFIASTTKSVWPSRTVSPGWTKGGAPGCGLRCTMPTIGALTASIAATAGLGTAGAAAGAGTAIGSTAAGAAVVPRATRMRFSPSAYSISLSPVSSSSAAKARTRSPSTVRAFLFGIRRKNLLLAARFALEQVGDRIEGEHIALGAEPADHATSDGTDVGMLAKRLAAENVGEMKLDDRELASL